MSAPGPAEAISAIAALGDALSEDQSTAIEVLATRDANVAQGISAKRNDSIRRQVAYISGLLNAARTVVPVGAVAGGGAAVFRSAVTVQLYDTSHTSRITPGDSYAEFRAQVEDAFSGYLISGGGKLKFTLHYYRIEDDPTENSKVKLDHDDPAVSAQRWTKYRHTYSEATVVLFAFSDAEPAERRSPLRCRMPNGLRISVTPLKPPFSSASNSAKERISPTLSGKAKERDGKLCVMCDALPVQSYGAHIIPHGDEAWCKAAGLVLPSALAWFVEQPINIVTLCDDCHKLFDDKAALWVEVDAEAADPARRLKITLHNRVPDCSDELLARCRARFPPSSQRFVRVPPGQRERDSFPCWSSYDALWLYRLRWSQAKHTLLCRAEDDARQRDALKANWNGTCGVCGKKGNGACTRLFSCKKCCGDAGGCAAAQHPDTREQGTSAAAATTAGDGSRLAAAAMRSLRIGE